MHIHLIANFIRLNEIFGYYRAESDLMTIYPPVKGAVIIEIWIIFFQITYGYTTKFIYLVT